MSNKFTRFEWISASNFILTLILSAIAVFVSYNTFKVSENTLELTKSVNHINELQSKIELEGAVNTLFTIIDMQRQNDPEGKDIPKCISTLTEMKSILESQMKNTFLAQNSELSKLWILLYSRLEYDIKFLGIGQSEHTRLGGVNTIISELEDMAGKIFDKFYNSANKGRIDKHTP